MPDIGNGRLAHWRAGARCYRRAMNAALATRPVSQSPVASAVVPDAANLREGLDRMAAAMDEDDPLRRAREDIIQYERAHPDVAMIAAALGVDEAWLDALFADAMALEQ